MRLDSFLKSVCLVKQRSQAKKACDAGMVRVGERHVKASHQVREGETLTIRFPHRVLTIEVIAIPSGQVAKGEADTFYRVLAEERPGEDG